MTLTVLTGCSLDASTSDMDANQGGASKQRAVAFTAYTASALSTTRADDPSVVKRIADGESMGVYAWYHPHSTWAADFAADQVVPNFMWNQQATRHDDLDAFVYSPLKYWPNGESDKLSFMAYYPYTPESPGQPETPLAYPGNPSGLQTLLANNVSGLPTFRFTVKDAYDSQVDFLVSDLITDLPQSRDTEGDPGTAFHDLSITDRVCFVLRHALSKVEFRIVADPEVRKDLVRFRLNSLGITNIYKDGLLTPSYAPLTGQTTLTWTAQTTTHDYAFVTYEPWLLMPQTLSSDAMLNLDYEMTFKSDGTTFHYEGASLVTDQDYTYANSNASLRLNTLCLAGTDTPLTVWLPNHHYVYVIRLRANRIEFTGEVVDWGDTESFSSELEEATP
jgi:hypothetical protein